MKAAGVFVLIFIAALSRTVKADGTCERTKDFYLMIGTMETCKMKTVIDSKNFSITSDRDESVRGFDAWYNNQLQYLPNNIGVKFPSLLYLFAGWCSIKEVSRDTFKDLSKLRELHLQHNQIEKIEDDTFEYIPAVEYISLYKNQIKKLNGLAFASLLKLTQVWLGSNECIDEYFITATRIAELPRVVTEKCGFTESESSTTKNVETEADLMAPSETSSASPQLKSWLDVALG